MTVPWTVTLPVLQGGFHRIVSAQDLCVCSEQDLCVCSEHFISDLFWAEKRQFPLAVSN